MTDPALLYYLSLVERTDRIVRKETASRGRVTSVKSGVI